MASTPLPMPLNIPSGRRMCGSSALSSLPKKRTTPSFFGQVVVDVAADPAARSANANGTIVIPFPAGESESSEPSGTAPAGSEAGTSSSAADTAGTDISVEVSLPVTWTEDGKAVCYVTFELIMQRSCSIIRWRPGTAESTSCLCITRLKISCRISQIPSTCTCGWRTVPALWGSGIALRPSVARPWRRLRVGR